MTNIVFYGPKIFNYNLFQGIELWVRLEFMITKLFLAFWKMSTHLYKRHLHVQLHVSYRLKTSVCISAQAAHRPEKNISSLNASAVIYNIGLYDMSHTLSAWNSLISKNSSKALFILLLTPCHVARFTTHCLYLFSSHTSCERKTPFKFQDKGAFDGYRCCWRWNPVCATELDSM
jgi:hypothetical protein